MLLLQGFDSACAVLAAMSLLLQLLSAIWRIVGQLAAVESLVLALLLPRRPLQKLHTLLAKALVSLGAGLSKLGLVQSPLSLGKRARKEMTWLVRQARSGLSVAAGSGYR